MIVERQTVSQIPSCENVGKIWNPQPWNVEKLKVEMLKMMTCWKMKVGKFWKVQLRGSFDNELGYAPIISNFSTFNISTFPTFQHCQHFQLSTFQFSTSPTFQHFNFPYRIQIRMFNLRKLKNEKLKCWKSRKFKCWKLKKVKLLTFWKCWNVRFCKIV